MKSNTNHSDESKVLDELHSDCKSWRRVASECVHANTRIPPSTEEQYKVVHGRILTKCRNLASEEMLPASRRHVALQLDELLRPWTSAKSLKEAPPKIVSDLVKSQTLLDERLAGRSRNIVLGQLGRLVLTACLAAAGGILIVLFLQWTSSNVATAVQPVQEWLANIATYIGQTSFTERFAVAILLSWGFGTWMLSRLSSS
jgi:hypothetical protein